ncbi:MAG: cobalamin-binding protein [Proteobacteria bacterium]|nr:MAG: cobalamin-binding protein [Pseudomonadota bacterium]
MTTHVTDQMQRDIVLPDSVERIVSLVPSQTELLFALGAGERVVGVTKFCTEPKEQVAGVAKVGGTKKFDFQAIAALKPDLIIGNKEENYPEGIGQLAQDYPVWMSDIVTLDDALAMIRGIGTLAGKTETANEIVATIADSFRQLALECVTGHTSELRGGTRSNRPVKVAYLIWQKPYMVAAGDTFITEMLTLGGVENVFSGLDRYPQVDLQTLQASDAEAVLLSSEPFPFRQKHLTEFQAMLPDKKILLVDAMPFSWYGSQLLRTASYLRELRTQL